MTTKDQPTPLQGCREAFEKWARERIMTYGFDLTPNQSGKQYGNGWIYQCDKTMAAYSAWQAAAQRQQGVDVEALADVKEASAAAVAYAITCIFRRRDLTKDEKAIKAMDCARAVLDDFIGRISWYSQALTQQQTESND